jgi:integrase
MPIYPRPDRGPEVWTLQVSARGQRVTRLFHGTRTQAKDAEAQLRVEVGAGRKISASAVPTLSRFCVDDYKPTARVALGSTTYRNREYQLASLMHFLGHLRLDKIGTREIADFVQARRTDGIGDTTIADDLKVLKRVLSFAVSQKRLGVLPEFPTVRPKARPGRVKFWTDDEVRRLLDASKNAAPRLYAVLVFLLNTGCRKTEAIRTRWAGVDFKAGTIWIDPVKDDEAELDWQPKDAEAREVPMSPTLRRILERLPRNGPYVFPTEAGTPYVFFPQRDFDAARDAAGLEGGPHTTRHTYASHFLAAGGDMFRLAKILGQEQSRVTEIYSHLLPGRVAAAASLVDFGGPARKPSPKKASRKASNPTRREKAKSP